MKVKPQLVLDIAGVLVSNLSPGFCQEISSLSGITYQELKVKFSNEIRKDLWTGEMKEDQFWTWLTSQCPNINSSTARELLCRSMEPLPAFHQFHLRILPLL